jgi:gluconolactonase
MKSLGIGFMVVLVGSFAGCEIEQPPGTSVEPVVETRDPFKRLVPTFDLLVPIDAVVEKVAGGFQFTEGPVWMPGRHSALLFSDIPANTVYRWTEGEGSEVFLHPVMADNSDTGGTGGSNGLALDSEGRLILCEHGNRRVARMEDDGSRTSLADRYENLRLNSPNDIVFHSTGAAFFTDPPYGLEGQDESPAKEQSHNGIYRLDSDGTVTLVSARQTRPNGIGLSPDELTLYVANSDKPPNQLWMSYPVLDDLTLGEGSVFFDANEMEQPGWADGLALDRFGNVYATGPGGVLLFDASGQHLGTIALDEIPTNVGWGDDGKTLYVTAHTSLYRIKLSADGLVYFGD